MLHKFQPGDKVRCLTDCYSAVLKGEQVIVKSYDAAGSFAFTGSIGHNYEDDDFELVSSATKTAAELYPVGTVVRVLSTGKEGFANLAGSDGRMHVHTKPQGKGGDYLGCHEASNLAPLVSIHALLPGDVVTILPPACYRVGKQARVIGPNGILPDAFNVTHIPDNESPTAYEPKELRLDIALRAPGTRVRIVKGYRANKSATVKAWPTPKATEDRVCIEHDEDAVLTNYAADCLEVLLEEPKKELPTPKLPTLVARSYWPRDNSWARCLNDPEFEYLLAGGGGTPPEQTTIVLAPFESLFTHAGQELTRTFVIVECLRGHYHQVIYDEKYLTPP